MDARRRILGSTRSDEIQFSVASTRLPMIRSGCDDHERDPVPRAGSFQGASAPRSGECSDHGLAIRCGVALTEPKSPDAPPGWGLLLVKRLRSLQYGTKPRALATPRNRLITRFGNPFHPQTSNLCTAMSLAERILTRLTAAAPGVVNPWYGSRFRASHRLRASVSLDRARHHVRRRTTQEHGSIVTSWAAMSMSPRTRFDLHGRLRTVVRQLSAMPTRWRGQRHGRS